MSAAMIRSGRLWTLSRSISTTTARSTASLARHESTLGLKSGRKLGLSPPKSTQLQAYRPLSTSVARYATPFSPYDKIRNEEQRKLDHTKLASHPDAVSVYSSTRQIGHEQGVEEDEEDVDMLKDIRSDMTAIKETFALYEVPKEALYLGLAGVLPYLATSLSTLYLAWDINHASLTGQGFLVSGPTAEALLHVIEPMQIGYGAVILSFLGAIHWGFEWSKYGGVLGYKRLAYGVVAPAVAWPTMLMPVEYALITQFLAFCSFYFADARAVTNGWMPHWYSTYRFVLTFIVGASIVVSLVGRGQIADKINRLPSPADRVKRLKDLQFEAAEEEEKYIAAQKAKAETEEDEDDGDEEEEEDDD